MPLTRRSQGVVMLPNSAATTALSEPVPTTTKPAINTTLGIGVLDCLDYPTAILRFVGRDAANETVNFQIVLWTKYGTGSSGTIYVPRIVAKGTYALGAGTVTVAGLDSTETGSFVADHIELERCEAGIEVVTPVGGSAAYMKVALGSAHLLTVGTDLGTAAGACVLGELSDEILSNNARVCMGGAVAAQAVTDALVEIVTIPLPPGATQLSFEVKNAGGGGNKAFDQFDIRRGFSPFSAWETVGSVAGDFSSPAFPLLTVTGAPVTLASAATCQITIDVTGCSAVSIRAGGNAGTTTVNYYWRVV